MSAREDALRVAILGAGPAGAYAAARLLEEPGVEVTLIDRLTTPWGLVRAGVAPDHQDTKRVTRAFEWTAAQPRLRLLLGAEVGDELTVETLAAHHDAVLLAVGASGSRDLGIPGEALAGSAAATAFVAWYNSHPDARDARFDLSAVRRVAVVGNGNVALDVARVLVADPERLARTDIADHALAALRSSTVQEVVVLGRRGPAQAAFTTPELVALAAMEEAEVVVEPDGVTDDATFAPVADRSWPQEFAAAEKLRVLQDLARDPGPATGRRVALRFLSAPLALEGDADGRVRCVVVGHNEMLRTDDGRLTARATGDTSVIDAELVLRAIGYRGARVVGVPVDEVTATIPNLGGRVLDEPGGDPVAGLFAAGWIKRGPTGVIGTNKRCSSETVEALLADHAAGRLPREPGTAEEFDRMVADRAPGAIGLEGWRAIDRHERGAGEPLGRPRVKLVEPELLREVAGGAGPGHDS